MSDLTQQYDGRLYTSGELVAILDRLDKSIHDAHGQHNEEAGWVVAGMAIEFERSKLEGASDGRRD